MWDKPSSACRWTGVFSRGSPIFCPILQLTQLKMSEIILTGHKTQIKNLLACYFTYKHYIFVTYLVIGERGGSVVECRTPEREVGGSKPTTAVLCPWARHFTPRKYWLITQEAVAPSRHDWKIVDWDVKPQHKQTNKIFGHNLNSSPFLDKQLVK